MKKPPDLYFPIEVIGEDDLPLYQVWDCMTFTDHFQSSSLKEAAKKSKELNKIFHEGGDPHYIPKGEVIT